MAAMLTRLLQALSYPRAGAFAAGDDASVGALVAWLENMKIRHYKVEERAALGDVASPSWEAAYSKYLQDLECPIPYSQQTRGEALLWLLQFATHLEYSDAADQYNQQAPPPSRQPAAATSSGRSHIFTDLGSAEVQQAVDHLLALLHVEGAEGVLAKQLQAIRAVLGDEVMPSIGGSSGGDGGGGGAPPADPLACLHGMSLGFSTGDAKVDAAATLLRLRFIQDLRALQSQIDGAIVGVQELTANPRTEASLGRVGR